jgi:hypothetical protein
MAYGIAINTIFGFKEVTNQKVPRLISSVSISASAGRSGSFTAPGGVTSSTGFAFTSFSPIVVSFSGSTVSWQYASSIFSSQDFTIEVVKTG